MSQVHLWHCEKLAAQVAKQMVAPVNPGRSNCTPRVAACQSDLQATGMVSTDMLSELQALQELSQWHAAELEEQTRQASQAAAAQEGRMHTLLAEARQHAQAESWCVVTPRAVQCPQGPCLPALLAQERLKHMSF